MPADIGVLLAELNVQLYHMFRMNLQLLHAQLHSIRARQVSKRPLKNFANKFNNYRELLHTRSSADTDKPARSVQESVMVPFDRLDMVSY